MAVISLFFACSHKAWHYDNLSDSDINESGKLYKTCFTLLKQILNNCHILIKYIEKCTHAKINTSINTMDMFNILHRFKGFTRPILAL